MLLVGLLSPSNLEDLTKLNSISDDVSDPSLVLMRCTKLLQNRYGINDSTGMALILNTYTSLSVITGESYDCNPKIDLEIF